MRIVIDLQCCQNAPEPAALQLARDLVSRPGAHEFIIALSDRYPGTVEALRAAFAPLLPRDRVRLFELPAPDSHPGAHWRARAAQLIRNNFIASLDADAVFVPHQAKAAGAVFSAPSAHDPYATVIGGQDDADAASVMQQLLEAAASHTPPAAGARPRLAYISPLPPEKSGIADYSAELVPELARFYDVELVVSQDNADDPRLLPFPLRTVDWFEEHAHQFDRVLYHFGNSHAHQHMFELIRRHPGIVVLHDFFFSGILDNLEREGKIPQGFLGALYESHGYTGLIDHASIGRNPAIWKYPLNKGVLEHASGVIVHSDFSRELATQWYGPTADDGWRTVPLLRGKVEAADGPGARSAARARLKLRKDDYLVCSFGMLGRTKLNEELLDAFLDSPLAADPHCKLVFVGQNEGGLYGATLAKKIADSAAAKRISITGFVTPGAYADYLCACDTAVQLRSATRGETSAAVLDCLLYGAPTIVNAHGSTASISPNLLVMLPDAFSVAELSAALTQLHGDARRREGLSQRAAAFMLAEHNPARVGELVADAIEHFAANGRLFHYQRLLREMARIPGAAVPSDADLGDCARAIAFNNAHSPQRQLFVDVSAVVTTDLKTGIQRVVRSVLLAMLRNPPPGYRIEPVFSTGSNRSYHYARQFSLGFIGETGLALEDAPIDMRPGDTFLGLDLFTNGTSQNEQLLQSMRDHGVNIYFVVYDILPMLRPDVFPYGTEQYFGDFLRTVSKVADGVVCISRAVADELSDWIGREGIQRAAPLQIGWFHLGADIDASAPSYGLPDNAATVMAAVAARPSFLIVGTVEPRKGHAQALAAIELLWSQGVDINFVVVGKQGWMVDKIVERMASHPEREQRLFWLPGVSDEMLQQLYAKCSALLAPSEGEGFGLPLIEAAQHGIAIIARKIPVFQEVAGEHALYFDGLAPDDLARAIQAFLALHQQGQAPASAGMPWLTWSASAQQLLNAVDKQQWYKTLPGAAA
ncbi:MAG: glycosyltransferase [Pseudomonadota bacterium]